jgi:YidC/Oxa1 family membrane protein insertase
MNKNSILGFVLIGAILIGFSWYNSKFAEEQQILDNKQDSIVQQDVEESLVSQDDTATKKIEESNNKPVENKGVYRDEFLNLASNREESITVLQNDKVEIEFTNIGAQPRSVRIKDYYTFDGNDLMLVKENGSLFNLRFYAGQDISSSAFGFDLVEESSHRLVYRLNVDSVSHVDYIYSLPEGSYMMDLEIKMTGLDNLIPRNMSFLDIEWNVDVPRLEKGYDNEKNYSTVVYKFPGTNSVEDLGLRKDDAREEVRTSLNWVAFQQQFFSAILVAENNFSSGDLSYMVYPEEDPEKKLMNCSASMELAYDGKEVSSVPLQFYFGPNHYKTLKSYDMGFEQIVPLGGWIIGWINRYVIILVFDFLDNFIDNYGIIILLLTILIKLVISPLTMKSYLSSAKMKVLKPEVDKINAKYPKQEDAMKKQQEVMALYNKTGVSMFGGCLPMLLQFPILFAMFRFFPASFELRQESFLWADDLSSYDSIVNLPFNIPLLGDHLSLFAILMALSMFFYSRMNMDQMSAGPQMAGMKYMSLYFMPLFLFVLGNNFSSGLSYYYLLSNLITMTQTWVIRRYFVDEEKILAQLKMKASAPKKKSKFQERLDAAYKAQQQQNKKRK